VLTVEATAGNPAQTRPRVLLTRAAAVAGVKEVPTVLLAVPVL